MIMPNETSCASAGNSYGLSAQQAIQRRNALSGNPWQGDPERVAGQGLSHPGSDRRTEDNRPDFAEHDEGGTTDGS